VLALFASFWAGPAAAWNAHGHMLIALVAYDALTPDKREALTTLLEAHPRFAADLTSAIPPALVSQRERARWLFAHAATWPDLIRGQPAYDHGTWHYVNLPLELRARQLTGCAQARRDLPGSVRRIAQVDAERRVRGEPAIPSGDSIVVALAHNQRTLADPNAPREARALALTWLLHLVGDAHQPLHGVALFTPQRFVTGDRGGNDILLGARGSLHRVWDGFLGEETSLTALEAALGELRRDRPRLRGAQAAAGVLDVDAWIDEDCELARAAVYVPAIVAAVERHEHDQRRATATGSANQAPPSSTTLKPEVSLRPAYYQHGREKARQQALRAGLRLAALLQTLSL
jgi:hypothetical protein